MDTQTSAHSPRTRAETPALLKGLLARAFRWNRMLDSGAFMSISELAEHERIDPCPITDMERHHEATVGMLDRLTSRLHHHTSRSDSY